VMFLGGRGGDERGELVGLGGGGGGGGGRGRETCKAQWPVLNFIHLELDSAILYRYEMRPSSLPQLCSVCRSGRQGEHVE